MRTIEEAIVIVKTLFSAPLGSFPRGGVESALRVRLSVAPKSITLTSEHGLVVSLQRESIDWVVIYLDEKCYYESLEVAIFKLIEPIIRDEISHRL
tara:strand:- start:784 stop:1071 length:288 start_codon:yes stop_codon:yes gene_type:complete